jgi:hypothetical protein
MITVQGNYQGQSSSPFSTSQWTFGANGIGVDVARNTGAMTINELARSNVSTEDVSASSSSSASTTTITETEILDYLNASFQDLEVCVAGVTATIRVLVENP